MHTVIKVTVEACEPLCLLSARQHAEGFICIVIITYHSSVEGYNCAHFVTGEIEVLQA
jgi:hypothetical protein